MARDKKPPILALIERINKLRIEKRVLLGEKHTFWMGLWCHISACCHLLALDCLNKPFNKPIGCECHWKCCRALKSKLNVKEEMLRTAPAFAFTTSVPASWIRPVSARNSLSENFTFGWHCDRSGTIVTPIFGNIFTNLHLSATFSDWQN